MVTGSPKISECNAATNQAPEVLSTSKELELPWLEMAILGSTSDQPSFIKGGNAEAIQRPSEGNGPQDAQPPARQRTKLTTALDSIPDDVLAETAVAEQSPNAQPPAEQPPADNRTRLRVVLETIAEDREDVPAKTVVSEQTPDAQPPAHNRTRLSIIVFEPVAEDPKDHVIAEPVVSEPAQDKDHVRKTVTEEVTPDLNPPATTDQRNLEEESSRSTSSPKAKNRKPSPRSPKEPDTPSKTNRPSTCSQHTKSTANDPGTATKEPPKRTKSWSPPYPSREVCQKYSHNYVNYVRTLRDPRLAEEKKKHEGEVRGFRAWHAADAWGDRMAKKSKRRRPIKEQEKTLADKKWEEQKAKTKKALLEYQDRRRAKRIAAAATAQGRDGSQQGGRLAECPVS